MAEGTIIKCLHCGTKNRVRPTPTGTPRCYGVQGIPQPVE